MLRRREMKPARKKPGRWLTAAVACAGLIWVVLMVKAWIAKREERDTQLATVATLVLFALTNWLNRHGLLSRLRWWEAILIGLAIPAVPVVILYPLLAPGG